MDEYGFPIVVEVAELRVHRESPVADVPLARAAIREQTGATIVGLWMGGSFTSEIGPDTVLHRGAILVAIGSADSIERLGRLATPLVRTGPFLVAGYGEGGREVVDRRCAGCAVESRLRTSIFRCQKNKTA